MLGASFDTIEENRTFAENENFSYQLLSDVDKRVGTAYQVTRPGDDERSGYPLRIAYLIDPNGVIRKSYDVTDTAGFAATVLDDLASLRG